jgi:hypothetical protein
MDAKVLSARIFRADEQCLSDGQVVWSWRPWAGAKSASDDLQMTVTNKVMDTGESAEQPLTPLRREGRSVSADL